MKVLFITRGFPSEKDPMAGNYEAVQAKAIAAKGHEVSVIAVRWISIQHILGWKRISHRVVDGINVYDCCGVKNSKLQVHFPRLETWIRQCQFKHFFHRHVQEIGVPDIVHCHIIFHVPPALFLKDEWNLPFIITEHWSQINKADTPRRIMNQTFAYHHADKVICVSDALARSLKEKCNIESVVINNMVNDRFFSTQGTRNTDGTFRFISVGSLRAIKRFDLMIEAFATCHFPVSVSLDIVGEGGERELLESRIRRLGLDNQVRLLGVKKPEEVNDLLSQSDCFVLASRAETFSIVLIEAMAKGLPVIATRCGGPETFVRPEDGILVSNENVDKLAEAMKYMVAHYKEYDADEIRQHCQQCFSQDVIADKIIKVYSEVYNNRFHKEKNNDGK